MRAIAGPTGRARERGGSGREGGRSLEDAVKTARKRSLVSTCGWSVQLNDPSSRRLGEGYRSARPTAHRDRRQIPRLFSPRAPHVILGAAPAAGPQVAAERVQERRAGAGDRHRLKGGRADRGAIRVMDFHDPEAPAALRAGLTDAPTA